MTSGSTYDPSFDSFASPVKKKSASMIIGGLLKKKKKKKKEKDPPPCNYSGASGFLKYLDEEDIASLTKP